MSKRRREHGTRILLVLLLMITLFQLPSVKGQTLQITNKGNTTDYPTSINAAAPSITVTIRWYQDFASVYTRFAVSIVESGSMLGGPGTYNNVPAGDEFVSMSNLQISSASSRPSWTLLAEVFAITSSGQIASDQYEWTVSVVGLTTCSDGQYWNGAQCVCPSGEQWNGQQCVVTPPTPTCSGGQYWNGAQCVCPSGQQWNGYQCVTPTPTCSGGQYWNGSACVCPSGEQWNGQQCVTPTPFCSGGQYWNGSQCVCPSGEQWNGQQCVTPPQQPQLQVRFDNVLDSANSLVDLGQLILTHGTTLDDIVVVASVSDQTLQRASIDYSPSDQLIVIRNDQYSNPLHWIYEVKSPALKEQLKDAIEEAVFMLAIVSACAALGGLTIASGGLLTESAVYACAKLPEIQTMFNIPGTPVNVVDLLSNLDMIWTYLIDPTISLDSVTVTYSDGSQGTIPGSSLQTTSLQFPTILGTISRLVSQGQWFGQIVTVHSPVALLVIDSNGRRIGETADGQVLSEIPDAFFVPPSMVCLSTDISSYTVQLTGTAQGSYGLNIAAVSNTLDNQEFSGSISSGQTVTYSVTNSNNQLTVSPGGMNYTNWAVVGVIFAILIVAISIFYRRRPISLQRMRGSKSVGRPRTARFCPECGSRNSANARFCGDCGSLVGEW